MNYLKLFSDMVFTPDRQTSEIKKTTSVSTSAFS